MNHSRLFLLFAAAGLGVGHSQPASDNPPHGIIGKWSGPHGGGPTYAVRTLQTAEAWDAFWKQVEREKPRSLNLAREMAVAIVLGERRTGGFSVDIATARAEDGKLVIQYQEKTPAPDMMVTQMLTAPWVVAVVPRSDLPVVAQKIAPTPQPRRP